MRNVQGFVVLVLVIVAVQKSQEAVQRVTTHGESGAGCGRSGRHCVSDAECVNNYKCACPSGKDGNAEFDCIDKKDHVCFFTSDSRVAVEGFGKGATPINIPCSYRASRFITRKSGAHSYCGIEVHVTNERVGDTFRARAVHVSVGVTEPTLQIQSNMEALVTGSSSSSGRSRTYNYEVRTGDVNIITWGSSSYLVKTRRRVPLIRHTIDDVNNFVILDVPDCDTRIKFRAEDSAEKSHKLLPGVSITVPETAEFIPDIGDYPLSLCGQPRDSQSVYKDKAKKEGLSGTSTSAIAAILDQQSPQFDNPVADQCQDAMDVYASSRDQSADLNACEFLLNKKNTRRCLVSENLEPLDVFTACLKVRQTQNDVTACSTLREAASKCKNKWVGKRKFCQ